MKLKPIVAITAALLCGSSFAAYHSAPVKGKNAKVGRLQKRLDRNQNPYYAQADWFRRVCLSGLVQVNAMYTNRDVFRAPNLFPGLAVAPSTPAGTGLRFNPVKRSATDLFLSRANLYLDADVNSWTEVHVAWDFANNFVSPNRPATSSTISGIVPANVTHSFFFDDERAYASPQNVGFMPDEAYIAVGDFAKSMFYARAGREYVRFGDYQRNVLPMTLTQAMSQTQADALEVGFVDWMGFNGSVAAFRGTQRVNKTKNNINNFVAQLGYSWQSGAISADVSADWMLDVLAVNYIANINNAAGALTGVGHIGLGNNAAGRRNGGFAVTAKANYEMFDMQAQVVSTVRKFNAADLTFGGATARPLAWMVGAGYTFTMMNNNDSHLGVNFQRTHKALALGLPKYRIQGDLTMDVWKNMQLGLTAVYDKDYRVGNTASINGGATPAGSGLSKFTGLLSASARFA